MDRAIADVATGQHGVVSLRQLRELGLGASAVRERVAAGRLHRIHREVFAVGHPVLAARGRWMAAVLACGPGAALSHRSAAALLDLRRTDRAAIDVTAARGAGRKRAGIEVHRSALAGVDQAVVDGIPCTTAARTLLDLAEVIDRSGLERAFDRAEQLRLLDVRELEHVIARSPGRRGLRRLRVVLDAFDPGRVRTRSELERRFLVICGHAGLPPPKVNHIVTLPDGAMLEVDFAWPERRLIVETDGHATHGTRLAFEADRRRDQVLKLAGWEVVRFTWRQVSDAPGEVAAVIAALYGGKAITSTT